MSLGMIIRVLALRREIRRRERWSRRELEAYQADALGELRRFASARGVPGAKALV